MSIGIWQIVLVLVLVVLLFGRGKISELMGDVAKGITSFRKGIAEGNQEMDDSDGETIDNETGDPVDKQDS
jgi:sec-independent protein translocase protein TatA